MFRDSFAPAAGFRLRLSLLISLAFFGLSISTYSAGQAMVTTYHNDNLRTGNNPLETTLTTTNVKSSTFGKLFDHAVDGFIYAQPLYVPNVKIGTKTHNVVFVATMNDSVYAFDADNNTGSNASALWKKSFLNASKGVTTVSTTDVNCPDTITTEIGILSTPVIDASTGTMYVLARTKENGSFFQRLHALDITTGKEKFGGPVVIQGSVSGTGKGSSKGTLTFDPLIENQRSALLLQNGMVYIAWGSLCDKSAYHGWLMAYDASTLAQKAIWASTPNASEGAIWAAGWGPAGDSSFNTFVPIANGTFDANTGGSDYGQAVVNLAPPAKNTFTVSDYFETYDGTNLDSGDHDIGSSGLVMLPDQTTGPHKHLLVQGDKTGNIYVVDRDNMGKFNAQNNDQIVQYLPAANKGMWNSPTWWNNHVYFGASSDVIKSFTFTPSTSLLSTTPGSETAKRYGYPGTTTSVSANQTNNGILWALDNSGYKTAGKTVLHAYDATNLSKELYNSNQQASRDNPGPAVKFTVPTIVNGKVYVGTQTKLSIFGLLSTPDSEP